MVLDDDAHRAGSERRVRHESVYELCGVVVHHGGSAHHGHFTAMVSRPAGDNDGEHQWYACDDKVVVPVNAPAVAVDDPDAKEYMVRRGSLSVCSLARVVSP